MALADPLAPRYGYSQKKELNMTVEKEGRSSSPVHVHVDDDTAVHVHMKNSGGRGGAKSGKQGSRNPALENKLAEAKSPKSVSGFGASNLRRSNSRGRNKSPPRGPWVPPPARTSSNKYAWQGQSHRLEVHNSGKHTQETEVGTAAMMETQNGDLDTEDEDRMAVQMKRYEQQIDELSTKVGSLQNQVDLERSSRDVDSDPALLEKSRIVLEEQQRELSDYRRELLAQEAHNEALRQSMEFLHDDKLMARVERDHLSVEREALMKKLVEAELDGQAAAKQTATLRDMIRRLREDDIVNSCKCKKDKKETSMTKADALTLSRQKELLMERLADFEVTNRALRGLLRERHEEEAAAVRLAEQRDLLLKQLAQTEDRVQGLRSDMLERDRRIMELEMGLNSQKQENLALSGMQSSLEGTRAHLQKHLRTKEADCNRMAVQIRSLESQLAQERIDVEHLTELLQQAKGKADKDKEALKKATRVQKQRAAKSEDALEQLSVQLMEREQQLGEARAECDTLRASADKLSKEKAKLESDHLSVRTRLRDAETTLALLDDEHKQRSEKVTLELQDVTSECARLKLDNQQLKTSLVAVEDKLVAVEGEASQLRSNLRQYETLVDEYRGQLNRSRREADETLMQLEEQKRETDRVQHEGETEIGKVKSRLESRLEELAPLPELLRTAELLLQDAQDKLLAHERRAAENARLIADLSTKIEKQGGELECSHSHLRKDVSEKQHLATRVETMDKRLKDLECQNRDLLQTVAKREEAIHQANMRLDEKMRENAALNRQLEQSLTETRRHSESVRDQVVAKERGAQARLAELEASLSSCRSEVARVKREKEEMERKFNSRLYDLKDRLEQSHSTNRSMQNYVQFLKNSYANVFGDSALSMSPLKPPSSFL